jgi:radical SAM protein with 4Fe4S-binding SPASM domain
MINKNKVNVNGKIFCVAPWLALDIRQDGEVKPCCVSEYTYGDIKEKPLWEIWNDEPIRKLRENMLNDVPSEHCQVCYNNQAAGKSSLREDFIGDLFSQYKKLIYGTNDDYTVSQPTFVWWDLKLSNKCNFKCRMCSWTSSSSFELEQNGKISGRWNASEKTYEEVEQYLGMVNHLYFSGGESLIIDEHWKILDKLIELGRNNKVSLAYNSNFSNLVYKGRHIFDMWDQFNEDLQVHISVDGIGARGELIRKGFKWDRFVSHAQQFRERFKDKEETHQLHFDCTVQALNIFEVVKLHQYLYTSGLMKDIDFFFLNFMQNPREMSVWILDKQTKEAAKANIRDHIDNFLIPNKSSRSVIFYESLIKYIDLYQEQHLIPDFLRSMRKFDKLRNESTIQTFPEFQRIWNVIKTKPKTL